MKIRNFLIFFICIVFSLFFLAKETSAQVVINEVCPDPIGSDDNEFIELYNLGSEAVNVAGWQISDTQGVAKTYTIPEIFIEPRSYFSFRSYVTKINLNNDGDGVTLKDKNGTLLDSVSFGKIPEGLSTSRIPDGTGEFTAGTKISEGAANIPLSTPEATSAPTPTPTASPKPDPTPYKATYKINTPKDKKGTSLKGVQIYVDGVYVHHTDEEIIQFFNGHECYTGVDCGLGAHTISLRKSGYVSWEDTQDLTAGANFEVNPVLETLEDLTSTLTSTPSSTPKSTPFKVSTSSAQIEASKSGDLNLPEILGINESTDVKNEDPDENPQKKIILPIFLILLGIGFIGFSIFSIIRNAKKVLEIS